MEKEKDLTKIIDEFTETQTKIETDMRDMLSIILPAVRLAQKTRMDEELEKEKVKCYLNIISKASYNMLRSLNNSADYIAIKKGTLALNVSACDIVALCRELVMTVSETASDKQISFSLLTDTESKFITCDCEKTERIILNILSNSIVNTAKGGSILLCLKDNESSWELTITDNGPPADDEFSENFSRETIEKDYAGTRSFCGVGMGLYLAQQFALLQGGSLNVSSPREKGALFTLTLPTDCLGRSSLRESLVPEYSDYSFEQKVEIELSYLKGCDSEVKE